MEHPLTRLDWLALMVVDEAAEHGASEPVLPSAGLRLALAYLHSIADGPIFALPSRRHIFDEFWRTATAPLDGGNPHSAAYAQSATVSRCLQQISRQIGQPELLFNEVRETRKARALAAGRAKVTAIARRFVDAEDQRKLDKRRYYWGPPPKDR